MPNFITIYCDCALCPDTKIGAWACWIKHNDQQVKIKSGPFNKLVNDVRVAELYAIANSLTFLAEIIQPKDDMVIVVVTNTQTAIDALKGNIVIGSAEDTHEIRNIAMRVRKITPKGSVIHFNKVNPYNRADGKRSYINCVVESAARSAMLGERNKVKSGVRS